MKYIEELVAGDIFAFKDNIFILTSDFKKNGNRMAVNLNNGLISWLNSDDTVNVQPIFTIDTENNIIPITNANLLSKTENIPQIPHVAHISRTS
jgi:hypothetical protein